MYIVPPFFDPTIFYTSSPLLLFLPCCLSFFCLDLGFANSPCGVFSPLKMPREKVRGWIPEETLKDSCLSDLFGHQHHHLIRVTHGYKKKHSKKNLLYFVFKGTKQITAERKRLRDKYIQVRAWLLYLQNEEIFYGILSDVYGQHQMLYRTAKWTKKKRRLVYKLYK